MWEQASIIDPVIPFPWDLPCGQGRRHRSRNGRYPQREYQAQMTLAADDLPPELGTDGAKVTNFRKAYVMLEIDSDL